MDHSKIPFAAIAALVLSTSLVHAQATTPTADDSSQAESDTAATITLDPAVEKLVNAIDALENAEDINGTGADATDVTTATDTGASALPQASSGETTPTEGVAAQGCAPKS